MVLRDKQTKGHGLPSTLFVSVRNREIAQRVQYKVLKG